MDRELPLKIEKRLDHYEKDKIGNIIITKARDS
jgi:hypothetical protein